VIVFCPGNSGNLSAHLEYVRIAAGTGRSVVGLDYTGFGASAGTPDLRRLVGDVVVALRYAHGLDAGPVALFGVSLGAASALAAAAGSGMRVDAIIVEGISDVGAMLGGLFAHGRFGPLRVARVAPPDASARDRQRLRLGRGRLPGALARAAAAWCCRCYPFEGRRPIELAARIADTPLLAVHGVEDELLPFEAAIDLYLEWRGPKRLWLIPGAGHAQEPALSHATEYIAQLRRFLDADGGVAASPGRAPRATRFLESEIAGDELRQSIASRAAEPPAWSLEVETLARDGFPERQLDERSARYRDGGYRDAFRRLVGAINQRDLAALDVALAAYCDLPRALPFDRLASMYALRVALAARGEVPGWPVPDRATGRRALARFALLFSAHEELALIDRTRSPLAWVEREIGAAEAVR